MDGLIVVCALAAVAVAAAIFSSKKATKSKSSAHPMAGMVFKSNEAFFEVECKYGDERIVLKRPMVALVEKDETDLGDGIGLGPQPDGMRTYRVRVANSKGGQTVHASKMASEPEVKVGDLVAWVPLHHYDRAFEFWHGAIIAKLLPEFVDTGVRVEAYY